MGKPAANRYAPPRLSLTTNSEAADAQASARGATQMLAKDQRLNGRQYVSVTLSAGTNRINHPLRRMPQGWTIVDIDDAATIYRTAWDSNSISLLSDVQCNIKLEIW